MGFKSNSLYYKSVKHTLNRMKRSAGGFPALSKSAFRAIQNLRSIPGFMLHAFDKNTFLYKWPAFELIEQKRLRGGTLLGFFFDWEECWWVLFIVFVFTERQAMKGNRKWKLTGFIFLINVWFYNAWLTSAYYSKEKRCFHYLLSECNYFSASEMMFFFLLM